MIFAPDFLHIIGGGGIAAAVISGYLCGSVPFGLIFTSVAGLGDIRAIGSGNTGATNVLRTGNRKIAALTLLCDMAKGAIPAAFFTLISPDLGALAGFCAFIGHIFPVWLKFKGGKGVATYLGVLLALDWRLACLFGLIWLSAAWLAHYSSLAALIAAFTAPFAAFFLLPPFSFALTALMSFIIFIRHKDNIKRLLSGAETRIKSRKS